ncbi:hypothetical protein F383_07911 [Gossypium arboreum]|uniref:Uncharacterized protein n=1 Tax=Gossypium arboreum TaxID=29729 RepID=A0A0B0P0K0_GOSAR|nr:hypothetical protein F383_07911 [Gossypium arboreum]
MCCRGGFSPDV